MKDPRYHNDVSGVPPERLPELLKAAMKAVESTFPKGTGVALLVCDLNKYPTGVAYIANVERGDMVTMMREFIARQEPSHN